jgi:hypothetical protein
MEILENEDEYIDHDDDQDEENLDSGEIYEAHVETEELSEIDSLTFDVSLDTEFTENFALSIQLLVEHSKFTFYIMIIHHDFEKFISREIIKQVKQKFQIPVYIFYDDLNQDGKCFITYYISLILVGLNNVSLKENTKIFIRLYMFYSLRDLSIAFSYKIMYPYYVGLKKTFFSTPKSRGHYKRDSDYFFTSISLYF